MLQRKFALLQRSAETILKIARWTFSPVSKSGFGSTESFMQWKVLTAQSKMSMASFNDAYKSSLLPFALCLKTTVSNTDMRRGGVIYKKNIQPSLKLTLTQIKLNFCRT